MKLKYAEVSESLKGKKFMVGKRITIADFAMFDSISWHMELMPMIFEDLIPILEFHLRMRKIEVLAPLLNSGDNYNISIFTQ